METWSISKYEMPFLAVEDVRFSGESGEVLIRADVNEYVIDHGEDIAARELARQLEVLRDPAAPQWNEILASAADSPWRALLESMDQLGLLRDAGRDAKARLERELGELGQWIETCAEQVLAEVPAER